MKVRTILALVLAVVAVSVSLVAAGTSGATATQGQPIIAGQVNDETFSTCVLWINTVDECHGNAAIQGATDMSNGYGVEGTQAASTGAGVLGIGATGVEGDGTAAGVVGNGFATGDGVQGFTGDSGSSGVYGDNTGGGKGVFGFSGSGNGVEGGSTSANGVQGETAASAASGVYGQNNSTGFGAAGRASNGTGVLGDSANGVGVWATSQNATALKVTGKAQFSRSGVATVAGTSASPQNSVRVSLPITGTSMMTALLQKFVAGVYVVAAVPNVSGGYFTIYLNKKVSTSVGPIAWIVTEHL
jgi:hypothetical protein